MPLGSEQDVEAILGLIVLSFGRGVGNLHIHRATVVRIRDTFGPWVHRVVMTNDPDWAAHWKAEAATVLDWVEGSGRLAAHIAMTARRTIIDPDDFRTALDAVVREHTIVPGRWCS